MIYDSLVAPDREAVPALRRRAAGTACPSLPIRLMGSGSDKVQERHVFFGK